MTEQAKQPVSGLGMPFPERCRRFIGPSLEGAGEGTLFGKSGQECDLGKGVVTLHQKTLRQAAARLFKNQLEGHALVGKPPVHGSLAHSHFTRHFRGAWWAFAQATRNAPQQHLIERRRLRRGFKFFCKVRLKEPRNRPVSQTIGALQYIVREQDPVHPRFKTTRQPK
nr:hypothetical protein [Jannaschia faecimaris]